MRVQKCKGTRDLSPGEMAEFRFIEGIFRDCCLKWGYQEIRTPTLEYLHLFTATGTLTPNMLNTVYSFLDWDGWSGERVVLRPDGTIPVARLYIDTMEERKRARLFYVANTFRFEESGEKNRERWQCGAELIGAGSAMADTELITLAKEVLNKLGLENISLRVSHAGLIRALLSRLELNPAEQTQLFDRILDGDDSVLAQLKSDKPEHRKALLSLLKAEGKSSGFLQNYKALFQGSLPEISGPVDDFINTVNILETLGCDCQIDLAVGKGFEYYTGIIFQLFIGDENVGGGGRYDALVPLLGGKDVPASGFALYMNRLMDLIRPEDLPGSGAKRILVKVTLGTLKEGFTIADSLRSAGYVVEIDSDNLSEENQEWVLSLKSKQPWFILTDKVNRKEYGAQTISEVLALLEGE
ncbi:ATP phosphoribosyltransferase regulatory subunit [Chloroflexota bacterium]